MSISFTWIAVVPVIFIDKQGLHSSILFAPNVQYIGFTHLLCAYGLVAKQGQLIVQRLPSAFVTD